MSIKIARTDHIVAFWHAENVRGDDFLLLLRKLPLHWRIDFRFRRERDEKIFNSRDHKIFDFALSGLQTPHEQVFYEAQETFRCTEEEFCMNRVCQRVDGGPTKFYEMLKRYSWAHMEVKKQ